MIFFVIPAHNEEALIGATIESLHRAGAACGDYRIIVAADSCTDRTAQIAAALGATVVPVSLRQISAVRNAGAHEALRQSTSAEDCLVFVDADTHVPVETLRNAMGALRAGAAGGGAGVRFDGRVPFPGELLLKAFVLGFRILKLSGGCFVYCTRRAFEATGGWDERLFAGEEVYMCMALKRQGRFVVGRDCVLTSGRKFRQYTPLQLLAVIARLALRGRRAVSSREGLELWYGPRAQADDGRADSAGRAAGT